MPNKDTHRPVGMALGGGYAFLDAQSQPFDHAVAETLGGVAGGWLGAALPDWIDPATSPNHRHVGHGGATIAGALWLGADVLLDAQQRLRHRADELAQSRLYLENDLLRILNLLEEYLLRFLAGVLNGIAAGYVSHLVLDALTARGIPLFARGC